MLKKRKIVINLLTLIVVSCTLMISHTVAIAKNDILPGAYQINEYKKLLVGKKVGLLINQTSEVYGTPLLDTLLTEGIQVKKVFVPEHGFRGTADAGAKVNNDIDSKTGLPIISLYGKNKKPTKEQLAGLDILIYDLQDVGVRFYTYISTLEYAMQACAESNITLLILDRPNPLGHQVDGPVLKKEHKSFVGMQPIPIVYGMTPAEYAWMLQGEKMVAGIENLNLECIRVKNYTHATPYILPVPPSPNLKNNTAIYLYPSLCLFEGTNVSVGRGTDKPFQQYGHPDFVKKSNYYFIPESVVGASKPLLEGKKCYGELLAVTPDEAAKIMGTGFNLSFLKKAYQWTSDKDKFFNNFFNNLAGNSELKKQIISGLSEQAIRASWQPDLEAFKKIRAQYLLYPEK